MSREIEYRAKDKNGDWVYGFYSSGVYDCGSKVHYIVNDLMHIMLSCWAVDAVEVDFSTLGQYTGIKDKNGVNIYEGDVVVASGLNDVRGEVVFERGCFIISPYYLQVGSFYAEDLEVIGNIHEDKK